MDGAGQRRVHATTKEIPRVRFERDERPLLLAVAERPYRSLVLMPHATPEPAKRIAEADRYRSESFGAMLKIDVEKRPLSVYAAVAGGL